MIEIEILETEEYLGTEVELKTKTENRNSNLN
jgi:hypothetical protein